MRTRELDVYNNEVACPQPSRALYEAGVAWRAAGRPGMAFAFLNCYLDVADAVGLSEALFTCLGLSSAFWAAADLLLTSLGWTEVGNWAFRLLAFRLPTNRTSLGPFRPPTYPAPTRSTRRQPPAAAGGCRTTRWSRWRACPATRRCRPCITQTSGGGRRWDGGSPRSRGCRRGMLSRTGGARQCTHTQRRPCWAQC